MKTLKTIKNLSLLLVVILVSFSCSNDDDNNNQMVEPPQELNIVETAQTSDELTSLVAAVIEADLVDVLSGPGPFTVLAPTNDAFDAFLSAGGWATVADVPDAALEQVLLNHVISGSIMSSDLVTAGSGYASTSATGAGDNPMSIYYDTSSGVRFNNVSSVIAGGADINASNGIVHVVDAVIGLPDIVTFATANPNFSTLVTALTTLTPATDFVSVLQGEGPFTVLAPVNTAFDAITIPTDESELTNILLNHVIGSALSSTDLVGLGSGYSNTLAEVPNNGGTNLSIYFDTSAGVSFNGISDVAVADVVASNGIIHAVDGVITLPTIATFATSNPALETLVAALDYADTGSPTVPYIDTVSDATAGPFTVFAPTNDAFGDVLAELSLTGFGEGAGELNAATTDAVLLYHIVNANVQSSQLQSGTVTTLGGDITADATAFTLTDPNDRVSNIITSLVDIQGVNGVVHVIDTVLLP
ncbi:MAG: fasciclin domain-containing protein [Flavobacteriaceae bacterium]|nr:fasciclin domain-containing protein [Bacteroidia bacterium]NNK39970.1 fasciclin domain-containing protein [Winogradskyella sp.]NNL16544.1 fasciclin domain-containing protein [Flavobacteriaceae bacterium]